MKKILLILLYVFLSNISIAKADSWSQDSTTYVVQKGDSWGKLSRKFQIPTSILKRYNGSGPKESIISAKKVRIPAKILHKIQNGETALKISLNNGITFSELLAMNNLNNNAVIKIGDTLKLVNAKVKKTTRKKLPEAPSSNIKLDWPVQGTVVGKFGVQENGSRNNDLRILVESSEIKAAAPGIVVYTGNEVGSYGNLIILQHENNWFSSYGNLNTILVSKGENINIGQVLGTVHSVNPEQKAELYFGLRLGARAVNPMKYLKSNDKKRNLL